MSCRLRGQLMLSTPPTCVLRAVLSGIRTFRLLIVSVARSSIKSGVELRIDNTNPPVRSTKAGILVTEMRQDRAASSSPSDRPDDYALVFPLMPGSISIRRLRENVSAVVSSLRVAGRERDVAPLLAWLPGQGCASRSSTDCLERVRARWILSRTCLPMLPGACARHFSRS